MTKTLTPRVPSAKSGEPSEPPVMIGPRAALAAGAAVALLAAVFAFAFRPSAKLPATQPVAAAHYSVQMANYAYAPASITVNAGDTITWTNQDTAPHTVTTTSGPVKLSSPYLSKGQSWSYTFTAPGMYMYYCTVHPDMRAEVIVHAPAAPAPTAAPLRTHNSAPAAQAVTPAPTLAHVHTATTTTTPTSPATSTSSAAVAAPAVPPSASRSAPSAAPLQAQQTTDNGGTGTLSPVLLLSGLTAAIAVFCLLLVASRAAPTAANASGVAPDAKHGSDESDDYDY